MKTPEQKFLDFTGYDKVKTYEQNIQLPSTMIHIGNAYEISYQSNKFDGKMRNYVHPLKKYGSVLIDPKGKLIVITGLNLSITKRGLTG